MPTNLLTYARRHWREAGYYVEKTEHVKRRGKATWREDLHGFADLVALDGCGSYVAIQVTSWKNVPSRVRKIVDGEATIGKGQWERPIREVALDFLSVPGHRIVVEGWRKRGGRWKRREHEVEIEDLEEEK